MKLIEYFRSFLENEVNLNETRIALLDQRVLAITNFLRESETFREHFLDIVPQGSYAHKTIIRPVRDSDGFDADVLLELEEYDDWAARDYVENLYTAFRQSDTYKRIVHRRTRCVKVDYAGEFHIDVVPYLERHGETYITNRHEDQFQLTDPEGYNDWLDERNRITSHHFVKVVRLVKYLRDFKGTFAVRSIILSALLGEQVNDAALLADPNCYVDVPTTLRSVMNRLSDYVEARSTLPSIMDPAGTGENFSDRWDQDGYANFRSWMTYYARKIEAAYLEPDKEASIRKWQEVFGDQFRTPQRQASASEMVKSTTAPAFQNTEETLASKGIREELNPRWKVRIVGRVMPKRGHRDYDLAKYGNRVQPGREIRFSVGTCAVPAPFQIFWKVKNEGPEARRRDMVRGQIVEGGKVWSRLEPTIFRGSHYVECYVVKDGVCVARDRQDVNITDNLGRPGS